MTYRITNATGRVCCSSDRLDLLCATCRAKATAAALSVPEPPPLRSAIAVRRGEEILEVVAPLVAANGVPVAPSLSEALTLRRKK